MSSGRSFPLTDLLTEQIRTILVDYNADPGFDTTFHYEPFDCSGNKLLNDVYHIVANVLRSGDLAQALQLLEARIGRKDDSYWAEAEACDVEHFGKQLAAKLSEQA